MTSSDQTVLRTLGRLPRSRLRPVATRSRLALAGAASAGALLVAGAWASFIVLRPLPTGESSAATAPSPPALPALAQDDDLHARQARLAQFASRGNVFAADRRSWGTMAALSASGEQAPGAPVAPGESIDAPREAAADQRLESFGELALSASVPQAIERDLGSLSLGALYGIDGDLVAVIRDASIRDDTEKVGHYRVGDRVGALQWRLLAIDPAQDRVIVERAGHRLELRMFPLVQQPVASVPETSAAPAANARGVVETDLSSIRAELTAEGFTHDEINALLQLVENPAPEQEAPPTVAAGDDSKAASPGPGNRAMPAEMVDLLRMMAADAKKTAPAEKKNESEQRQ